jgi:hypothetical protein
MILFEVSLVASQMDTIGDAYIVVAGLGSERELPRIDDDNSSVDGIRLKANATAELLSLALEMQRAIEMINAHSGCSTSDSCPSQPELMSMRIGVAEGSAVAGVIGTRQPRFQFFGTALALAEEMQRRARPGEILVHRDVAHAAPFGFFHFSSDRDPVQTQPGTGSDCHGLDGPLLLVGEADAGRRCETHEAGVDGGSGRESDGELRGMWWTRAHGVVDALNGSVLRQRCNS